MRKFLALLLAGAFVVVAATPALALRVPKASTIEADFETAYVGDDVTFTVLVNGPVAPKGRFYVRLSCFQNGEYLLDEKHWDFYEPFSLVLPNADLAPGAPTITCQADLVYFIDRKPVRNQMFYLDSVRFDVETTE